MPLFLIGFLRNLSQRDGPKPFLKAGSVGGYGNWLKLGVVMRLYRFGPLMECPTLFDL